MSLADPAKRVNFDGSQVRRLVEQLARAEAELSAALDGGVDLIIAPAGQTYLLREAQQALLRSEAAAKEKAALLGAIFDNAPDLIVFLDRHHRIRFLNASWMGQQVEQLIGADWLSFQLPDQKERLRRIFESVIYTGRRAVREGPGRSEVDGSVGVISCHFGPVIESDVVVGVVVISREITAQKAAEAQLISSDRMATMGTLAAGVAHEINNPLTTVIANLDLMARHLEQVQASQATPSELADEINDARTAAERVRRIVRDLKLFSRADEDKREALDVEQIMDSTLRMAENEIRHRARLVKEYGRVPRVFANESRLGQVFLNLVVNAAQAIPEGNVEGNVIRITTCLGSDEKVHVKVADTGPGIPPEIRRRLFTPFFTTKPIGTGTGLGLSISQRIVTALGGAISFESEVGKGTEFRVVLPVSQGSKELPVQPAPSAPPPHRRGRILVVDDEVAIGSVAKRILSRDHEVVAITESQQALKLIQQGMRFDVILCDVMIPQVTGIELYENVARIAPEQAKRFVFMTGGTFTPLAREFIDASSHERLEKPFDPQGLRSLINKLVGDEAEL
jgi:PAS domain S-box-containing protein